VRRLSEIVCEDIIQFILRHAVVATKIAYTLADLVSANFSRIPQSKLSKTESVLFGLSFLAGFKTSDRNNGYELI
jgi:hypothetical protein